MVVGQFARILAADMYSPSRMFMRFLRKGMGARTVRQGLTRMQGRHRRRAMQKFYPRRALPPRAPPWRKYFETIYHSRRKGKASPEGDAKILSEAGLAPSGSPAAQIS